MINRRTMIGRMETKMNLSQLTQLQALKKHLERFQQNHPKFPRFLNAVYQDGLEENTIIEINVSTPSGKQYMTNMRLNKEDLDFIRALKEMNQP